MISSPTVLLSAASSLLALQQWSDFIANETQLWRRRRSCDENPDLEVFGTLKPNAIQQRLISAKERQQRSAVEALITIGH